MLTQTLALFQDAYRELNAKKLFWITMILSGVIVLAFAAVGINEQGLTIFHWELPFGINTATVSKEMFYKQFLFMGLGVKFWLAWGATILALVSTAGIIPDFVTSGSMPVMLAKPISRVRLFLTKYAMALLFVAMQVGVFSAASFVVLGLRAQLWEPAVFLAIPMVIVFFSYLYCVCALIGLLTRSTIAALILTGLFWFALFAVNVTESALLSFRTIQEQRIAALDRSIEQERARVEAIAGAEAPVGGGILNTLRQNLIIQEERQGRAEQRLQKLEERRELAREDLAGVTKWHRGALAVKTALPKTQETIQLTERVLVDLATLTEAISDEPTGFEAMPSVQGDAELGVRVDDREVQRELLRKQRARSAWWIVGTSLLFEGLVLTIACVVFWRRDY